jgi:predicted nucleotidyltransferase
METQKLLSTPERARILEYLLANPGGKLQVRSIARKLEVSPASVSNCLGRLREKRMIEGNLDIKHPIVRALKILMNIEKLDNAVEKLKPMPKEIKGIGAYGSWASGTNTENSDIDIWLLADSQIAEIELARMQSRLKNSLNTECSLLAVTPQKLAQMKEKDPVMYYSLVNSFILRGAGIDRA